MSIETGCANLETVVVAQSKKKKKGQLITLRYLLIRFHRISPKIDINSVICNFCLNVMSLGCLHLSSPKWNWIKYLDFAFWCLNILKLIWNIQIFVKILFWKGGILQVKNFFYVNSPHLPKQWLGKKETFSEVTQFCLEILVKLYWNIPRIENFIYSYKCILRSQKFLEPYGLYFKLVLSLRFPFHSNSFLFS